MSTAFVMGHGLTVTVDLGLVDDGVPAVDTTFVPAGMTVHLHAEPDTVLPFPLALHVMATQPATGLRTHEERTEIVNLSLTACDDGEIAKVYAVFPTDVHAQRAAFVGSHDDVVDPAGIPDDIRLCEGDCIPETGHDCEGLLDLLAKRHVTVVHIIACTGGYGDAVPTETTQLAADLEGNFHQRIEQYQDDFMANAGSPANRRSLYAWFCGRRQAEQAMLRSRLDVDIWVQNAWLKSAYLDVGGPLALAAGMAEVIRSTAPQTAQNVYAYSDADMLGDDEIAEALERASSAASAMLRDEGPFALLLEAEGWGAGVLDLLFDGLPDLVLIQQAREVVDEFAGADAVRQHGLLDGLSQEERSCLGALARQWFGTDGPDRDAMDLDSDHPWTIDPYPHTQ